MEGYMRDYMIRYFPQVQEPRRRKGSISRYDPDAEAARPQQASCPRPPGGC